MAAVSAAYWEFLLVAPGAGEAQATAVEGALSRTVGMKLNDACSASFTLDATSDEARRISEMATDLVVYRDDAKIFRGRIAPSVDTISSAGHTVQFTAWDYREMLNRRLLLPGDTVSWKGIDQEQIAWNLISTTQSRDSGDLGIQRGLSQLTGVNRTRVFEVGSKVGESIQVLSEAVDGFEWEIDPDLFFQCYYPLRGNPEGATIELGGLLLKATRTVDPSEYANMVRLVGGAGTPPARPANPTANALTSGGYFEYGQQLRYRVTAFNAEGESAPSKRVVIELDDDATGNSVQVSWDAVDDADGYNIYGRNRNTAPVALACDFYEGTATDPGRLKPNRAYTYQVQAVTPDGFTATREIQTTTPNTAGWQSYGGKVHITWSALYGATSYRVYGRNGSSDPKFIGSTSSAAFVDDGSAPTWNIGATPEDPFEEHLLATVSAPDTSWIDTSEAVLRTPIAAGALPVPELSATVYADDLEGSAQGRWEYQETNTDLRLQAAVDSRAQWLLSQRAIIKPSYSLTLDPTVWRGPATLWLGDAPTLSVHSGRLDVEETDLRITEIMFTIGDDGAEDIVATLGIKPRNIYSVVRTVRTRLSTLERR